MGIKVNYVGYKKFHYGNREPLVQYLDTLEELFSFLHSLVYWGSWGLGCSVYPSWEHLVADVALNPNDQKLKGPFGPLEKRNLYILVDGKVFDPRPFKKEISDAKPWSDYKPRGEAHNYEGYGPVISRRPSYKHYMKRKAQEAEDMAEWGIQGRTSGEKWWWYKREFVDHTRCWKDRSKSRKQWGKKKSAPIKRGYANKPYGLPNEEELEALENWLCPPLEEEY